MSETKSANGSVRVARALIAEGDFDVTRGLHHLTVGWNQAQTVDRLRNWNVAYLIILIAHHRSEVFFVCQLHGFNTKARREDSIEGRRRAAALQMAEHAGARFLASSLRDLGGHDIADASKSKFTVFAFAHDLLAIPGSLSFSHHNQRAVISGGIPRLDRGCDLIVVKGDLRHQ